MLVNWQSTLSERKRCFRLYSEDQPLSGTRTTLPTQQPGRMFEQISVLDFQMDETNSDTVSKWNIVLKEMRKNFETSYAVSNEELIKANPMISTVSRPLTMLQEEREAQGRQRRQRHIDYSLKGLGPKYLQRKAQENLMENLNATWNDFSTRVI